MEVNKCFNKAVSFLLVFAMLLGMFLMPAEVAIAAEITKIDWLSEVTLNSASTANGATVNVKVSTENSNATRKAKYAADHSEQYNFWQLGGKAADVFPPSGTTSSMWIAIDLGEERTFDEVSFDFPTGLDTTKSRIGSYQVLYTSNETIWNGLPGLTNTKPSYYDYANQGWSLAGQVSIGDDTIKKSVYNSSFTSTAATFTLVKGRYVMIHYTLKSGSAGTFGMTNLKILNTPTTPTDPTPTPTDPTPTPTPSPSISPSKSTYIKGSGETLSTEITLNGNALTNITTGQSVQLEVYKDYRWVDNATVSQTVYFENSFLDSLPSGNTNLMFNFTNNFKLPYTINAMDPIVPIFADTYLNNPGFGYAIITPDYEGMSLTIGHPAVIDVNKASGKFPVFNVTNGKAGTSIKGTVFAPGGMAVYTFPDTTVDTNGNAALTIPDTTALTKGTYKVSFVLTNGESKGYDDYYFTAINDFNNYRSIKNAQNSNNANVPNVSPDDWAVNPYPAVQLENGKLVYIPDYKGNQLMDHSLVGYKGGGVALPNVPVLVKLKPLDDNQQDAASMIQEAIDYVSRYPLIEEGYRGTVYLDEGVYRISRPLIISASGVVIRGAGQGSVSPIKGDGDGKTELTPYISEKANQDPEPGVTKLISTWQINTAGYTPPKDHSSTSGSPYSTARNSTLIYFDGQGLTISDISTTVTDQYVGAGQYSVHVASVEGLSVGDLVSVQKAINVNWVKAMYMDKVDDTSSGSVSSWLDNSDKTKLASGFNGVPFASERTIKSIDAETKTITFSEPLTDNLDMRWGVSKIVKVENDGRLTNVGVENIQGISDFKNDNNGKPTKASRWGVYFEGYNDENHAQVFIQMNNVRDSWVRNFTTYQIDRAFATDGAARNITVQDGYVLDPVSLMLGGERRYSIYYKNAEFMFAQRIYSRFSRHAFVVDSYNPGPNVFYDSVAEYVTNASEPHFRWSSGGLYDNVSARIFLQNRWNMGTSHGHAGVNYVLYNCDGPFIATQPQLTPNYVIGHHFDSTSNLLGLVTSGSEIGRVNPEKNESDNMKAAALNGGLVPNFKPYEYSLDDKVTVAADNMPNSLYLQQLIDKKGAGAAKVLEDNKVPEMIDNSTGDRPKLTGLYIDGSPVPDFAPDKYSYTINMPLDYDYTKIPEITATAPQGVNMKSEHVVRDGVEYTEITLTDAKGIMSFYVVNLDIINKTPIIVATNQQVDASNSNYAVNVLQNDYTSGLRWAANGQNWIRMYLGETTKAINGITIGFYQHASSNRTYKVRMEYSQDGRNWSVVPSGTVTSETYGEPVKWSATADSYFDALTLNPASAAEKLNLLQTFTFDELVNAKFIRVSTNGNITGSGANAWAVFTILRPVFSDGSQYTAPTGVAIAGEKSVKEGGSIQLSAEVTPSNTTVKEVIWSSSDTSVAVVDSKGKVTGVKAGNATITATTVDGTFVSVGKIEQPVASMDVNVISATIPPVTIIGIDLVERSTKVGTPPVLPEQVTTRLSNDTTSLADVIWNEISPSQYAVEQTFTVQGAVYGTTLPAIASITVLPADVVITALEEIHATTVAGKVPVLDDSVNATYSNGNVAPVSVEWEAIDPSQYAAPGKFTVHGSVYGTTLPAIANITVLPADVVITALEEIHVSTVVRRAPVLADSVNATYSNGNVAPVSVTWGTIDPSQYAAPGKFTVYGSVYGTDILAIARVTVNSATTRYYPQVIIPDNKPKLDPATGEVKAVITAVDLDKKLMQATSDDKGNKTVTLEIPKIEGATSYSQQLPASALTSKDEKQIINIVTEIGTISATGNMLENAGLGSAKEIVVKISKAVDKEKLPADVKAKVGDRPIIELSVMADGKQVEYNNPEAPVQITIPYTPTAEEMKDPEHIVVWYIDGSGRIVAVPSGRYNPKTGMVTFTTTHFSQYTVNFVQKTFGDLAGFDWAKNEIEVLASKGIINGKTADIFNPSANITRADFMVLLTKTLGLNAKADENFDDVSKDSYYYNAIAIAKKLGITKGEGNNKFNPDSEISRQDMMVLTARALKYVDKLNAKGTAADMNKFTDASSVADYAGDSVASMIIEGLIKGNGNIINPLGEATRAEIAVLMYRIYSK